MRHFNLESHRLVETASLEARSIQRTRVSSSSILYVPPADDLSWCLHFV